MPVIIESFDCHFAINATGETPMAGEISTSPFTSGRFSPCSFARQYSTERAAPVE
jgi:hypothetical protein